MTRNDEIGSSCFDEGALMAFLDGESGPEDSAAVEDHVRDCASCADELARMEEERGVAARALGALSEAAETTPVALPARPKTVVTAGATAAAAPAGAAAKWPAPNVLVARFGWTRIAAAAAAVLIAVSFAFAPVRTVAANVLSIFRVQKVQTIDITAADISAITDQLEAGSGHVDLKSLGEVWFSGVHDEAKHVTKAEAEKVLGFAVKLPTGQKGEPTLMLQPAQSFKFKLNATKINALLTNYGATTQLPEDVDGKVFTVNVPPVLFAAWGEDATAAVSALDSSGDPDEKGAISNDVLFVAQSRSPELVVPDGVDAAKLRDVLVNLPFLPESVRSQLRSVDDWQHTLLIPNMNGTARNVTLDSGIPAVVMTSDKGGLKDAAKARMVIWNEDGVVRMVGPFADEDTALRAANSMVR